MQAPGWSSMAVSQPNTSDPVPLPQGRDQEASSGTDRAAWVPQAEEAVRAACRALTADASQLDQWDSR